LLICLEVFFNFKKSINIIVFYIAISYLSIAIYIGFVFNLYEFTVIILVIICFDSSCYLFGKIFGKNKILNKISPNKTYEGLFGGIIFTNLISLIFYLNFDIYKTSINSNVFFFINIIILFSFFGDLIQSYFKRLNNLKDSSNFLPGHGGFFDRFDSFLLVIIPFSIHRFLF
jgi:phosphatidate cytidylyltransferase